MQTVAFAITNDAGEILRTGTCPLEFLELQAGEGEQVHQGAHDRLAEYWSPEQGSFVVKPPRPTPHHTWRQSARAWVDARTMADHAAAATARIEAERIDRTTRPIAYAGATLDADATAQDNLKAKLAEIDSRRRLDQPMPAALLVWRDADNHTHVFPDQDAYADWIGGLVIAISQRGTEAYAWAWAQKAALAAAAASGDVAAVDAIPTLSPTTPAPAGA